MKKKLFTVLTLIFVASGVTSINAEQSLQERSSGNPEMIQKDVKDLSREFNALFPGPYAISDSEFEIIKEKKFPRLLSNGEVLNNNSKIEAFGARNKAYVAILLKEGNDFVVISSNFKKSGDKSVDGLKLDHENTAFKNLNEELGFHGKVTLWGKDYVAKVDPLKNRKGKVVGAILVALPVPVEPKNEKK